MVNTRTLSQKRAEYALRFIIDKVSESLNNDDKKTKEFANFVAGAPASILKNGLGQTLAFWYQKGYTKGHKNNDKYSLLLEGIREWLSLNKKDVKNNFIKKTQNTQEFILELSKLSQREYLDCQEETLRLLEWIKRYANAELK